ncbi:MAG: DUF1405 domain-containing protein [Candidatus Methanoperedens sp.]|nr:DUF1405 domain-containing protein [Candidatus Methanoperedens sp.]MCZ7369176.1 DUF1405 domain-containing protein [Candidatus Methanoperedens sp.]
MKYDVIDFFFWFKKEPLPRIFVLISCIMGTLFGFYYYTGQFEITPVYLWFFVPDSPFFTFMYVIVLLFYSFGVRSNAFDAFTFIGLNKVGIWTIFVLFWNYDYYFSPETSDYRFIILLLHIGMILVAMTLLKEMKKLNMRRYLLIAGFFLISDFFDYVVGTHPIIPQESIGVVSLVTISLTIITCALTFYYLEKKPEGI